MLAVGVNNEVLDVMLIDKVLIEVVYGDDVLAIEVDDEEFNERLDEGARCTVVPAEKPIA